MSLKSWIWISLSCVTGFPGCTKRFIYLQKSTQSLETMVHKTSLTKEKKDNNYRIEFDFRNLVIVNFLLKSIFQITRPEENIR